MLTNEVATRPGAYPAAVPIHGGIPPHVLLPRMHEPVQPTGNRHLTKFKESLASIAMNGLLVIACLAFQFVVEQPSTQLREFVALHWERNSACEMADGGSTGWPPARLAALPDRSELPHGETICKTQWYEFNGNFIEIYYAGVYPAEALDRRVHPKRFISLKIESEDGVKKKIRFPRALGDGSYRRLLFKLSPSEQGKKYRIVLHTRGEGIVEAAILGRVDISTKSAWQSAATASVENPYTLIVFCLSLGSLFLWGLRRLSVKAFFAGRSFWLFWICAGLVIQFRCLPYFHADEWGFAQRIQEKGIAAVLLTHNEHFIPVFSLFYYLEYQLFGGSYSAFVMVSTALHIFNAGLLLLLLLRITKGANDAWPSVCVSFLYLISGSHTEDIQWVLCQSSVLATTGALISYLGMWIFLERGSLIWLVAVGAGLLVSCFSLAVGFTLFLFLPVLLLLYRLNRPSPQAKRLIGLTLAWGLALIVAGAGYATFRDGFKHPEINKGLDLSADELWSYTTFGSQFGTILRASGILPFADIQAIFPIELTLLCRRLADAGEAFSIFLLLLYLGKRPRSAVASRVAFWAVGQLLIVVPMFVVALGRAQLGVSQAASFRYQAFPLIGWALLVYPLISLICSPLRPGSPPSNKKVLGSLVFTSLIAAQLFLSISANWFSRNGQEVRAYLAKYRDWSDHLERCDQGGQSADCSRLRALEPMQFSVFHQSMIHPQVPKELMARVSGWEK